MTLVVNKKIDVFSLVTSFKKITCNFFKLSILQKYAASYIIIFIDGILDKNHIFDKEDKKIK